MNSHVESAMSFDFSMILLTALVLTGSVLLWDRFFGSPRREQHYRDKEKNGSTGTRAALGEPQQPLLIEYVRALFPVIAIVFVLRSFIVEPFRIPSGSMIPTLHIGDFILVNKFRYGIRLPVINKKVIPLGKPQAGDVMVFRYPCDGDRVRDRGCVEKQNFIKRVIGTPGDRIVYEKKKLFINDKQLNYENAPEFELTGNGQMVNVMTRWVETVGDAEHEIIVNDQLGSARRQEYVVPENSYFVMGDNRDGSSDSRVWGVVPEEYVVGKAFLIWFSWKKHHATKVDFSRIGNRIR